MQTVHDCYNYTNFFSICEVKTAVFESLQSKLCAGKRGWEEAPASQQEKEMVISNLMGFSHLFLTWQVSYSGDGIYRLSGDILSLCTGWLTLLKLGNHRATRQTQYFLRNNFTAVNCQVLKNLSTVKTGHQ